MIFRLVSMMKRLQEVSLRPNVFIMIESRFKQTHSDEPQYFGCGKTHCACRSWHVRTALHLACAQRSVGPVMLVTGILKQQHSDEDDYYKRGPGIISAQIIARVMDLEWKWVGYWMQRCSKRVVNHGSGYQASDKKPPLVWMSTYNPV